MANFCRFRSCIVRALSFSSNSLKDKDLSLYTTLKALSCSLFILLFSVRQLFCVESIPTFKLKMASPGDRFSEVRRSEASLMSSSITSIDSTGQAVDQTDGPAKGITKRNSRPEWEFTYEKTSNLMKELKKLLGFHFNFDVLFFIWFFSIINV